MFLSGTASKILNRLLHGHTEASWHCGMLSGFRGLYVASLVSNFCSDMQAGTFPTLSHRICKTQTRCASTDPLTLGLRGIANLQTARSSLSLGSPGTSQHPPAPAPLFECGRSNNTCVRGGSGATVSHMAKAQQTAAEQQPSYDVFAKAPGFVESWRSLFNKRSPLLHHLSRARLSEQQASSVKASSQQLAAGIIPVTCRVCRWAVGTRNNVQILKETSCPYKIGVTDCVWLHFFYEEDL